MRVPVSGTSAYKYEQTVVTKRRVVKKKVKVNKRRTTNNLLSIVCVTLLAFCLLGRNAYITEKSACFTKLCDNYETINSKVITKQFELEQKIDIKSISEISTNRLGMQTPEKHQLVYIDMQNADYAEGAKDNTKSFFVVIQGSLSRVLEYFG